MGRIVVSEFVTVDGVMQDPGGAEAAFGRGGWAFQFERGPDGDTVKLDEMTSAEALLLGRITYEGFAAAWPNMTDEHGFADKMNSMPKYVVSTTMDEGGWANTTVLKGLTGTVAEEVARLRAELDGNILINGSARLVQTLTEHDLVDEYRLMVYPIVLGAGKRLFGDTSHSAALRLVDMSPVGKEGVMVMTYRPAEK